MSRHTFVYLVAVILFCASAASCSDNNIIPDHYQVANEKDEITSIPEFVASLTPNQEKNLSDSGKIFLESQQHDAVNSIISKDIPTRWGFFNLPKISNTRAVGVNGGSHGQYWSMIRVKTGTLV